MNPNTLHLICGFGGSADDALLLAAHPEEWAAHQRTLILSLNHGAPCWVASYPGRLYAAWTSPHSGRTYATTEGRIVVFEEGSWVAAHETPERVKALASHIWGISDEDGDVVFCGDEGAIHVREAEAWRRVEAPEDAGAISRFHGRAPDAVYCCSEDGLLLWDGEALQPVEGPDAEPWGVWVCPEGDVIVTADEEGVYRRTGGAWRRWETAFDTLGGVAGVGDVVYAETAESGLARVDTDPPALTLTGDFRATPWAIGAGLVVACDDVGYRAQTNFFTHGEDFEPIQMPACMPGCTRLGESEPPPTATREALFVEGVAALRASPPTLERVGDVCVFIFSWDQLGELQRQRLIEHQLLELARQQARPGRFFCEERVPCGLLAPEPLEIDELLEFDAQSDGVLLLDPRTGALSICRETTSGVLEALEGPAALRALRGDAWSLVSRAATR